MTGSCGRAVFTDAVSVTVMIVADGDSVRTLLLRGLDKMLKEES